MHIGCVWSGNGGENGVIFTVREVCLNHFDRFMKMATRERARSPDSLKGRSTLVATKSASAGPFSIRTYVHAAWVCAQRGRSKARA